MPKELTVEEQWYKMLTEGEPIPRRLYHLHGLLPADPRCKLCGSPFKGWGGFIMHLMGRDQSRYNPRFCQKCEVFEHPGGAEVVLTMLFADVRGSTTLAEKMSAREFSQLINRFYKAATHVLIQTDALVDRLLGDEAIGLYIPGFAGPEHPRKAVEAARENVPSARHAVGMRLADAGQPAYQVILSNPPLHQGIAEDRAALQRLIADAPAYLAAGGILQIVVQRRLALDRLFARHFADAGVVAENGRYRVWRAQRA